MNFTKMWFKGKQHYELHHHLRAKMYRVFLKTMFSNDIPFQADIKDGVHFSHNGLGIVINPNSHVGGVLTYSMLLQ